MLKETFARFLKFVLMNISKFILWFIGTQTLFIDCNCTITSLNQPLQISKELSIHNLTAQFFLDFIFPASPS